MKRGLFVLLALLALGGLAGCMQEHMACNGGDPCIQACGRTACCWPPCGECPSPYGHGDGRGGGGQAMQPQQPPVAAVTYPYYTLRGPRDFLQRESPPIGP